MEKLRLGFLASHGGSNMQAIMDSVNNGKLDAELCAVISNNSKSGALQRAQKESVPGFHISSATHPNDGEAAAILDCLKIHNVNLVILAWLIDMLFP